jgi:polar amino acid transport system ATP-binding protein/arginine:pyruvate transaminase
VKFSQLVTRIAGDGADAWRTHYAAQAAQERGEDVIILSIGDPALSTPQAVVDRAIDAMRAEDTHYTTARGRETLRRAIAQLHARRSGQQVGEDEVVVTAGAQNALLTAAMCLAGEGDELLTFDPYYATYPGTLKSSGATLVPVPLRAENRFRLDLADLAAAITVRTRALFFANPGNPTGIILSDEELADIGAIARRHDLWIVADEVYAGIAPGGRVPSLADRMPERVVTVGSLSKTHAMCGWRAGWMIGPKTLMDHAENLLISMLYGLPGFIQEAALVALDIADESERKTRDYCTRRAQLMVEHLKDIPGTAVLAPQAGMFLLLDIRGTGLDSTAFTERLFRAHGVAVMDGGAFGEQARGFVRLSFAIDETLIVEACRRIRQFCEGLARGP